MGGIQSLFGIPLRIITKKDKTEDGDDIKIYISLIAGLLESGKDEQDNEDAEQRRVDMVLGASASLLRIARYAILSTISTLAYQVTTAFPHVVFRSLPFIYLIHPFQCSEVRASCNRTAI